MQLNSIAPVISFRVGRKGILVFRKYVSVPVSLTLLLILVNDLLIKIFNHVGEPITKPGMSVLPSQTEPRVF